MSDANAGLAFPANKAIVSMEVVNLSPLGMRLSHKLDGWGGWIRTNVWRDQNPLPYHLATPQHVQALQTACAGLVAPAKCPGQAPAARRGGPATRPGLVDPRYAPRGPPNLQPLVNRRHIQPSGNEALPAVEDARRNALGIDRARARRKNAGTRSGEPRRSKARQPVECVRYLAVARPYHRLAVVSP